ncbi:Regulator of MON1-CCZ1 complex [Linum perenne]
MSASASSSQLNVGLSGSGGLSHVYSQYPPLRWSVPGSRGLYYDDANKLLLSPTSDQIFSWKTVPFSPEAAATTASISEGPILSIRYSLDAKSIAVQRSNQEIQFIHRETQETFTHTCRADSESILGFFWTDCPLCDLVLVKTSGLDLLTINFTSKSLSLVETKKLNVSWYIYTHESRLILLASGLQCKTFTGFQLSSVGIVRLPRFEMVMAKSDASSKPILAAEDVFIVTVYGRIYCLQIDRIAMQLHLYRFYRDAVVQQGSLPMFSSKIAVSVVDNVLLVHQVDARVTILYDIFADSRAPITAPLPLLLRGLPRSNTSRSVTVSADLGRNTSDQESIIYGDDWTFLVPDLICDVASKLLWKIHLDLEVIAASSSEVPSILEFLQRRKQEASKVRSSGIDYTTKQLCLAITRTIILERKPVPMVSKAMDILVSSYSHSLKTNVNLKASKAGETSASAGPNASNSSITANNESRGVVGDKSSDSDDTAWNRSREGDSKDLQKVENSQGAESSRSEVQSSSSHNQQLGPNNDQLNADNSEKQDSQLTSPAISPDEMYTCVFAPVEEAMDGDPSYLVSIIVEFLRSTNSEKIKVHPNIYILTIQLLAHNGRFAELSLFIINKVLEPSKEVAMQLLESGRQNSQIKKLALDMLRQLFSHHDYVVLLVRDGCYLEALRYARKNQVTTVPPSLFLESALASKDSQHLAAVLRFFSDFIPGFRNTSEHKMYFRILNEMSTAVAV